MKLRIFILALLLLLLTNEAFSACPYLGSSYTDSDATWSIDNYCDSSQSAAVARRDGMAANFYRNDGPYTSSGSGGIEGTSPAGTVYYISYVKPIGSFKLALFWVACPTQRTQAQQQCGGADKYIINEDTCSYTCTGPCASQKQAKSTECGGLDKVQCDDQCNCSCTSPPIAPECAQQYEALCVTCGSCNKIINWNDSNCSGQCNCPDVSADADSSCGGSDMYTLNANCTFTCKNCQQVTSDCSLHCVTNGQYVSRNVCSQNAQAIVTSAECVCGGEPQPSCVGDSCPSVPDPFDPNNPAIKTCAYFRARCNPACNFICQPGVGGVALSHNCACASANPQTGDPETPPSNPQAPDDTNGWLRSIKEGIDANVRQNNDLVSWLKSQKENTDRQLAESQNSNRYLDNLAENNRRTVDNLDSINRNLANQSQAQIDAINALRNSSSSGNSTSESNTTKITDGLQSVEDRIAGAIGSLHSSNDASLDRIYNSNTGISSSINSLSSGLSNVSIRATDASSLNDLGGGDAVTGAGYGAVGSTGYLPSSASIQSAFGTYAPTGSGYGGIVRSAFSEIEPVVSNVVCSSVIHVPVPTLSGFEWHEYPFDLCPYAQFISMMGDVLVFLTALYELYKFAL